MTLNGNHFTRWCFGEIVFRNVAPNVVPNRNLVGTTDWIDITVVILVILIRGTDTIAASLDATLTIAILKTFGRPLHWGAPHEDTYLEQQRKSRIGHVFHFMTTVP